ncbi:MAG: HEAT repeat domain-containing protein [Acidobacteriota bacterium]|nr:HEAT repeat domain-containing protein [Acidobacteriota bacterium]|tara:strand:+ start:3958 stop:4860 length:903 start_codon:yes stop_codon:yes gene_type:complete
MNETSALDDIERQEDSGEPSPLRVALGFFILPMLLVFGAIGVFLLFGLIAHEDKSVDEYLAEVTGGGINEPWQGAFGLANKLAQDESLYRDPGIARRIAAALGHPSAQAPRVRTFLLLALGSVGHESSVPVVVEYLDDPNADVRLNAIVAISNIGVPAASATAPQVAERLKDDDETVRGYSAYVLGTLGNTEAIKSLEVALNDPVGQVRWNAAVALARLGTDTGRAELHRMIDRDYLMTIDELNLQQQQDAMIAAIQAFAMIGVDSALGALTDVRDNDPDLRVREAARAALNSMHRPSLP